jgi:hypothetical protein
LEEGVREGRGPKKCRSAIKKEYFVVLWLCGYHLPEYTVSKPRRTKSMHLTWWSGIIWWHFLATNAVTVLPVARYPDPRLSIRHAPRTRCLRDVCSSLHLNSARITALKAQVVCWPSDCDRCCSSILQH